MSTLPSLEPKQTAAVIRRVLRETFPAAKFSVTTGRGSMVSSVDIRWTDGPTVGAVDAIVGRFQAGSFNGMTDSYDYDRDRVIELPGGTFRPGTRYVHTNRRTSIVLARRAAAQVARYFGLEVPTLESTKWNSWEVEAGRRLENPIGNHFQWSDLIHQAAGDRSRFTFATGE